MVAMTYNIEHPEDELNLKNYRNVLNSDKCSYNCAGYALNTFSWYCPNDEWNDPWEYYADWSKTYVNRLTGRCVNYMVQDFEGRLRVIKSLSEVKRNEYALAFRVSSDGDFHFIRRTIEGRWYHKRGGRDLIEAITQDEVLYQEWCGRYDGPIVLMAMKRVV